jgi:quercetin dioxygenase-like cupin family protein
MKVLRLDESTRASSVLLRFEAGATFPAHNHPGGEEVYVLEFGHFRRLCRLQR